MESEIVYGRCPYCDTNCTFMVDELFISIIYKVKRCKGCNRSFLAKLKTNFEIETSELMLEE